MPRKSKVQSDDSVVQPAGETPPQASVMSARAVRKVAKKSGSRKSSAKKSSGTRTKSEPTAPGDASEATERRQPTDDEIRLRAYFIAERRVQMGIAGSEDDDWMEARRQLEAELGW